MLSDNGAKIAIVDLGQERCDAVVKEITDCHGAGRAQGWNCNVRNNDEVEKVTNEVVAQFGRIDILVNCAGVSGGGMTLEKMGTQDFLDTFQTVVDVNLTGTLRFIKSCTPHLIKAAAERTQDGLGPSPDGTSRIINIASVAGLLATGGYGYDGAKHGVIGITKTACTELGPKGITVNAICPGLILTGMTQGFEDAFKNMAQSTPAKRAGEPEDIAQVIYWLCTPASGFVNGEYVVVDGWVRTATGDQPLVFSNLNPSLRLQRTIKNDLCWLAVRKCKRRIFCSHIEVTKLPSVL